MATVAAKKPLKENSTIGNTDRPINTGEKRKETNDVKSRKAEETKILKAGDGSCHKKLKVSQGESGQQPQEGYLANFVFFVYYITSFNWLDF